MAPQLRRFARVGFGLGDQLDSSSMLVRLATLKDLPGIVRVYNESVVSSTATFDIDPVNVESRTTWFEQFDVENPLFVCDVESELAGVGYYLPYRAKSAYAATKELSVYVASEHHGKGIGSVLLAQLIEHAEERHVHVLLAVIAGVNPASVALHTKHGFEKAGRLRQVGNKFGSWVDTTLYQRVLS